jgi:MgtC family
MCWSPARWSLDPSRVAAEIVTGVGFLGAGLIFVRCDSVRGLTAAAAIWVTAAIGSAAGAGLPVLAVLTTVIYFLIAVPFPVVTRRLPRSATAISALRVRYPDGRSILRDVLREATNRGFAIDDVDTETLGYRITEPSARRRPRPAPGEEADGAASIHPEIAGQRGEVRMGGRLNRSHSRRPCPSVDLTATGTRTHGRIADGGGPEPRLGGCMRWSAAPTSGRSDGL